ncbi:uncharacterized protein N7503_000937 [Penicillium pulvis]|uniref:uncharacterized protein n=1 Tax=Penicillium pulvis TaxID=1562058 RepID=UPI002548E90F|nr:uncharacterized protein N7503_000937 [Penicillium pulvis]KAJ5814187.1 hypothetical protein N7503_000937 [Penicillium pulvis]
MGSIGVPFSNGQTPATETREFLENRIHLPQVSPYQPLRPLPLRHLNYEIQRPLPGSAPLRNPVDHHPRYLMPRCPLTIGTELLNNSSSPTVESQNSGSGSDTILSLPTPPVGSFPFSQVQPPRPSTDHGYCASPTSTIDQTPRTSVATEYLFRQSTASSSIIRLSDISPFPPPWYPPPSQDPPLPQDDPRLRAAGLVSPLKTSHSPEHSEQRISVVPRNPFNPRWTRVSLASSQAIPSNWGYDFQQHNELFKDTNVEKGDKPMIFAISKPHPASMASTLDSPTLPLENLMFKRNATASPAIPYLQDAPRADIISHTLSEFDQEARIKKLSVLQQHTTQQDDETVIAESLVEETEALPKRMPTMREMRLSVHKPAQFDAVAVYDTDARSTTPLSLIGLIRSATDMASILDHGNVASQTDFSDKSSKADFRAASKYRRDSSSFSDLLAEFPPPGLAASKVRDFLPVSLWRSKLRNVNSNGPNEHQGSGATPPKRGLRGMSRKQLIMICILALSTVLLAVLLPVLLVLRSKDTSATSCGKTTPCQNGGASVSSTTGCSCVCVNGYTGYQCTTIGDSSCVTSDVTLSKHATMGSSLPNVFSHSQVRFGIHLDQVAIMALFSTNNVSCKTENKLVSLAGVEISSDTKNARRSIGLPIDEDKVEINTASNPATGSPTVAPRSWATKNGILYDNSTTNTTAAEASTDAGSKNITTVPSQVVEFSRVAVLFILEQTGSFESAVNTKENIQLYLVEYYNSSIHPSLQVLDSYDLDYQQNTITLPNGTRIGG